MPGNLAIYKSTMASQAPPSRCGPAGGLRCRVKVQYLLTVVAVVQLATCATLVWWLGWKEAQSLARAMGATVRADALRNVQRGVERLTMDSVSATSQLHSVLSSREAVAELSSDTPFASKRWATLFPVTNQLAHFPTVSQLGFLTPWNFSVSVRRTTIVDAAQDEEGRNGEQLLLRVPMMKHVLFNPSEMHEFGIMDGNVATLQRAQTQLAENGTLPHGHVGGTQPGEIALWRWNTRACAESAGFVGTAPPWDPLSPAADVPPFVSGQGIGSALHACAEKLRSMAVGGSATSPPWAPSIGGAAPLWSYVDGPLAQHPLLLDGWSLQGKIGWSRPFVSANGQLGVAAVRSILLPAPAEVVGSDPASLSSQLSPPPQASLVQQQVAAVVYSLIHYRNLATMVLQLQASSFFSTIDQFGPEVPVGAGAGGEIFVIDRTTGVIVASTVPSRVLPLSGARLDADIPFLRSFSALLVGSPLMQVRRTDGLHLRVINLTRSYTETDAADDSTQFETSFHYGANDWHLSAGSLSSDINLPWVIAVVTRDSDFDAGLKASQIQTAWLSVVVGAAVLLISLLLMTFITKPFYVLASGMLRIAATLGEECRGVGGAVDASASQTVTKGALPRGAGESVIGTAAFLQQHQEEAGCLAPCCQVGQLSCTPCTAVWRKLCAWHNSMVAWCALFVAESWALMSAFLALQHELLASHASLLAANESKKRFIRYVFHEVRVPFNAIVLGIEQLREDLLRQPALQAKSVPHAGAIELSGCEMQLDDAHNAVDEVLSILSEQSGVVARLLNDVLSFQKIEDGKLSLEKSPFDMADMLLATLQSYQPSVQEKHLELAVDCPTVDQVFADKQAAWLRSFCAARPSDCPLVAEPVGRRLNSNQPLLCMRCKSHPLLICADRYRLRQVFANFLSNAVKFSPAFGAVRVVVSYDLPDNSVNMATEQVSIKLKQSDRLLPLCVRCAALSCGWQYPGSIRVRVSVQDSGPGLSPAELSQMFGAYVQFHAGAQQQGNGTGLGLNIAKSLVDLHEGSIGVHSAGKSGDGCEFFFEIPTPLIFPPRPPGGELEEALDGRNVVAPEPSSSGAVQLDSAQDNAGDTLGFTGTAHISGTALYAPHSSDSETSSDAVNVSRSEMIAHTRTQPLREWCSPTVRVRMLQNPSVRVLHDPAEANLIASPDSRPPPLLRSRSQPESSVHHSQRDVASTSNGLEATVPVRSRTGESLSLDTESNLCLIPTSLQPVPSGQQPDPGPAQSDVQVTVVVHVASSGADDKAAKETPKALPDSRVRPHLDLSLLSTTSTWSPEPTESASASVSSPLHTPSGASVARRLRVLVAEDAASSRKLLVMMLKTLQCDVVAVEDGLQAVMQLEPQLSSVEMLEERVMQYQRAKSSSSSLPRCDPAPAFDVLLTDGNMPRLNGVDLTCALRRLGYTMPIIAVTGDGMEEDQQLFRSAGVTDIVIKPATRATLKAALKKCTE